MHSSLNPHALLRSSFRHCKALRCHAVYSRRTGSWYEGPSDDKRQPQNRDYNRGDRMGGQEKSTKRISEPSGQEAPVRSLPQDRFSSLHGRLEEGSNQSFVISKEAWSKLLDLISNEEQAQAAMQLMIKDAAVRDENNWDWKTSGYGQTIFQLVQASALVGVYRACDWVIENAETLRVTIGNDTLPNMMRKVAAAGSDVSEVERLYALERDVRGGNSHAGFYEMSKVYKKSADCESLSSLIDSAQAAGVPKLESLIEELEAWLAKKKTGYH